MAGNTRVILSASPGKKTSLFFQIRKLIRYNRRNPLVSGLAGAARKFLRAYDNEGVYDFEHHGELFLLETYARWREDRPTVLWDVGANAGQWAAMARSILHKPVIHSFEVVPSIADAYERFLKEKEWATLHRIGLSDAPGVVDVHWHKSSDQESAINLRNTGDKEVEIVTISSPVSTIDLQISEGVPPPAFLKIDTEGHEGPILRGGKALLEGPDAPELIQLEYGSTWIPARETLERVHGFLEAAGYSVGRLCPRHVEFKSYEYSDDTFQMGNIVACREPGLKALLSQ